MKKDLEINANIERVYVAQLLPCLKSRCAILRMFATFIIETRRSRSIQELLFTLLTYIWSQSMIWVAVWY